MTHSDPKTDFDWAQMVYNIQGMVTMEQNSVTNMMESVQSFNFSRVVEAVEVMINKMKAPMMPPTDQTSNTINVQNIMKYGLWIYYGNQMLKSYENLITIINVKFNLWIWIEILFLKYMYILKF